MEIQGGEEVLKFHNQHKILISELKLDPSNPNELTQEQEKALDRSIDRFGFVYPICYDANTKIIADGEHRLQRLIEKGEKEVTAIPIEFKDDSERRLFRQTMNKLHGTHEVIKDAREIEMIINANKKDDLLALTAWPKTQIESILKQKEKLETIPSDITEINPDNLETKYRCPKCGYEWS